MDLKFFRWLSRVEKNIYYSFIDLFIYDYWRLNILHLGILNKCLWVYARSKTRWVIRRWGHSSTILYDSGMTEVSCLGEDILGIAPWVTRLPRLTPFYFSFGTWIGDFQHWQSYFLGYLSYRWPEHWFYLSEYQYSLSITTIFHLFLKFCRISIMLYSMKLRELDLDKI